MSRENIMFPSAKQILSYQQGDFNINDVHDFFRFHTGDKFFWIEKSRANFRVCFRGSTVQDFVSNFKVMFESVNLDDCIIFFHRLVFHFLKEVEYAL